MKRYLFTISFLLSFCFTVFGQRVSISGNLKSLEGNAMQGVTVTSGELETTTDASGFFRLSFASPADPTILIFNDKDGNSVRKTVSLNGETRIRMGAVYFINDLEPEHTDPPPVEEEIVTPYPKDQIIGEDRIPIITLSGGEEENDLGPQNISGILSASRDPFVAAAAFNLSTGGYDIRGFRTETTVLFNGMPFNTIESESVFWSVWGGLNDVTRSRESAIDLSANANTFGGISGYTTFDTRASKHRVQKRISYMFANRAYTGRLMGTWSTGMQQNGWAFTLSGSRRWAEEGYVPGTYYNAYSYFASVDRKINDSHALNLTALGAPIRRGSQGASVQHANDLAGTNFYNPNWGYQTLADGSRAKRNSSVVDAHQPLFVLRHDWKISDHSSLITAIGYQFGRYGRTRLDWLNAPDPRADYYRKLPVYAEIVSNFPERAAELEAAYLANPDLLQLQWDDFYAGNTTNGYTWEGTPGNWSQVILSNQRSDSKRLNGSTTYENIVSDHVTLNGGITWQREQTHYFKTAYDMLGGDYTLNLDPFALRDGLSRSVASFNLRDDDEIVRKGDTYGWDYDINGLRIGSWMQAQFSFRKVDFFAAANMTTTEFWRTGHFQNGRFPNTSYGDSEKQEYANYGAKAGVTYKFDGRNYVYLNGAAMTRPPSIRNAYISPRNRDELTPGLQEEKLKSWEIGYQHRSPRVKARATYFYTKIDDRVKFNRFFFENAGNNNFGAFVLSGLDERHTGVELAVQANLTTTLSASGTVALSENIYTSRSNGLFVFDGDGESNSGEVDQLGTVYTKGFYVPNSPQTAMSFSLDYRSPKFWSISATLNYFDHNYLDFSPNRRTIEGVVGLGDDPDLYDATINQIDVYNEKRLGFEVDHFSVDLFANKSYRINSNLFFSLTASVTNLLNAKIIQGGYEQLRSNPRAVVEVQRINNPGSEQVAFDPNDDPFGPRYFYAYGTNFFVMGALRF